MSKIKELYGQMQEEILSIIERNHEGDISNLDALLSLREGKAGMEACTKMVSDFEQERFNEIAHDASQYPEGYHGYTFQINNGRKTWIFKGIPAVEDKERELKGIKDQYSSAYEGVIKGIVQTTTDEAGNKFWIDENGDCLPLPDFSVSKGSITLKEKQKNPANIEVHP
jgi:hypothetical protein